MTLSIGDKLGRYEIRSQIGAGGMGEVYLARDAQLERTLALKVLPADVAQDQKRMQRFKQEARAASALNHPHLAHIYEIGEDKGRHFIAMEFVDGETLRGRMAQSEIKLGQALDICVQAAGALSAAHEAKIIHRDIKPENIMLRADGYIKILDFGLAKLMSQAQSAVTDTEAPTKTYLKTEAGAVVGTIQYMSPEQARGLQVDARTDVWSLGCVLYEMVTGRFAFAGASAPEVIAAILEKEPPPLARYAPDTPAELERIARKALAKDREERYQTIKDLLIDLRGLKQRLEAEAELERSGAPASGRGTAEARDASSLLTVTDDPVVETRDAKATASGALSSQTLTTAKSYRKAALVLALVVVAIVLASVAYFFSGRLGAKAIDSLAVLPFVNTSNDPNTEYLSDGITDSLINSLSQLPNMKVMSRNSVFRFKGREQDAQAAAHQLGVRAVLTGRVVQHGDNLSISVELIDARDNSHLWGEQYNRHMSDILAVQEEITKEISEKLRLKLTGESEKQIAKRYTQNVEAYRLYLRGQYEWNKFTPDGLRKAIEYFNQAIAVDPSYALTYAGLASVYDLQAHLALFPTKEIYPKAKWAAEKALALDDALVEAHTAVGRVKLFIEWDWPAAEREFKRALELNPNSADAHMAYSSYLKVMTRYEEEIAEVKRALELDPLSSLYNMELAEALYMSRRYDEAIAQCQKTLELDPHFPITYHALGRAYEQKGMFREAIAAFQKLQEILGRDAITVPSLAHVYGMSGERKEAQKAIDELQQMSKQRYVAPYWMALAYAGIGDKDQAFAWLDKAVDDRFFLLIWIKAEPRFDPLRSDPRYRELLQRINLKP